MNQNSIKTVMLITLICTVLVPVFAKQVNVADSRELSTAFRQSSGSTTIILTADTYTGGLYFSGISGEPDAPIIIRGENPDKSPVFAGGGSQAMHFADCSHIRLENITVRGYPANGINIDDSGTFDTPAHHITLKNITILDTGPSGNHDALKLSGLDDFIIKNCRFQGWGGSGIDMVGCHKGLVTQCTFIGKKGYSQSNAVQLKGGTAKVLVEKSIFRNTGQRGINLGGSTGLQFFRPQVNDYEAKEITVAGNTFIGGITPVAYVTAYGGNVHHNTIIRPKKWILRILQETKEPKFKPCHHGVFANNLIVYDSNVYTFVNVGPGTSPETFTFRRNAWHDTAGNRQPKLPVTETGGIYQPKITLDSTDPHKITVKSDDPRLHDIGAAAYKSPVNGSGPSLRAH